MKNFLFNLLFIAVLLACLPSFSVAQDTARGEDAAILKKMEYDWLIAEFKLDTATISKMMDSSFIAVGSHGVSGKKEELDGIYQNISKRLKEKHIVDSLYLDEFKVSFYNDAAIITFVSVTSGRKVNLPFSNRRTRFYDVWIKRNGAWKAVASQGTPLF